MGDSDSDTSNDTTSALTPQRISAIAAQLSAQSSQSLASLTRANTKRNGGYTPFVAGIMRVLRRVRVPPPPSSPTSPPSPSTQPRPRQVSFAPTLTILIVKSDRSGLDVTHIPLPPDRPNSKQLKSTLRRTRPSLRRLTLPDISNVNGNRNVAYRTPTPRALSVRSASSPRALSGRRAQSDNFSARVNRSGATQLRRERPGSVSLPVRSASSSFDNPPNALRRRSTPRIESGMSSASTTSTDSSAMRTDSDSLRNLKRHSSAVVSPSNSPKSIQDQLAF